MEIIDISKDLLTAEIYPGDPEPNVSFIRQIENGDSCNLSVLFTCLHTGTHVDAPLHFLEDEAGIDELPLDAFIGPCTVLEMPDGPITGATVNRRFPAAERILIKGGGSAYFMKSAAYEAVTTGIKLIGTDACSVGSAADERGPHTAFLSEGVAVLEGLDLSKVSPGEYFLFAPPIKIGGRDGAQTRAVLISDFIFWSGKN
jgi:arylformamidase